MLLVIIGAETVNPEEVLELLRERAVAIAVLGRH